MALVILFLGVLFFTPAIAEGNVTKDNWYNHTEIKNIRTLVVAINKKIDKQQFTKKEHKIGYCQPGEDISRVMYSDGHGVIRKFFYDAGSDDSSINSEAYYDEAGKIRFLFVKAGAVNGTTIQHRIYFNIEGKRIWEFQKKLEGPGYTFPSKWPDELIVFDPLKRFNAKSNCQ